MKKILIFGGAFDPPHRGHLLILKNAIKKINPDKIIIVVDAISPWKDNSLIAPYNFRKQMMKNLIGDAFLYNFYNNRNNYIYSIDVIKDIHNIYSNYELYFLLGQDQYVQFNKWNDYKKIDQLVTIVCHHRFDKKIKKINEKHIIISFDTINISSTKLKNNLDKKMIGIKNYDYIIKNNLYLLGRIKPLMSSYRYNHTINVLEAAKEFAIGNKANKKNIIQCENAAILHDICKEMPINQYKKYMTNNQLKKLPSLHCAHGVIGSKWLEKEWKFTDKAVLKAIANHVIPAKNMSFVSKILFCADKLEKGRTEEDITNRKKIYKIAVENINKAYKIVLQQNQSKYKGAK